MEALLERESDEFMSDSQGRVTGVIGRQSLLAPLHEQYYASDNQTAYKRGQEEHSSQGKHPDHEVEADVGSRLGRFAYVNDNRVLLQQAQEAHQSFRFCALQAAASSASSTSVRTPTPVAPYG